jgi:hypothetical protein
MIRNVCDRALDLVLMVVAVLTLALAAMTLAPPPAAAADGDVIVNVPALSPLRFSSAIGVDRVFLPGDEEDVWEGYAGLAYRRWNLALVGSVTLPNLEDFDAKPVPELGIRYTWLADGRLRAPWSAGVRP